MSGPSLTDTEREAVYECMWTLLGEEPDAREMAIAVDAVERILAARVAEAVDRERAAWATKIEALADKWERDAGPDSEAWRVYGPQTVSIPFAVATLRALLAADDTAK